jgi:hypothetical protein
VICGICGKFAPISRKIHGRFGGIFFPQIAQIFADFLFDGDGLWNSTRIPKISLDLRDLRETCSVNLFPQIAQIFADFLFGYDWLQNSN